MKKGEKKVLNFAEDCFKEVLGERKKDRYGHQAHIQHKGKARAWLIQL